MEKFIAYVLIARDASNPANRDICSFWTSPHLWLGTEPSCLILFSDDTTGNPLYGIFKEKENLGGCFGVYPYFFKNNRGEKLYMGSSCRRTHNSPLMLLSSMSAALLS
ncbi:MAG: hypothetical protein JRG73_19065 [Deltaproteobacteria bacterium]|nr:hypothetical protein [Deltaproteobacteria bacterium]MBW2309029.1 hypothetical protein [Deltaproteobacteria bacterium]